VPVLLQSLLLVDEHGNPVSISDENTSNQQLNKNYKMYNYPNPFNPSTTIQYELPKESDVTIKLFDLLGKEIATVLRGKKRGGKHTVVVDFNKYKLSTGIYFYTLLTNDAVITHKLIYLK